MRVLCLLVPVLMLHACNVGSDHAPPVQVLYNGKIFTADDQQLVVEAVAFSGDTIIAVGDLKTVREKAGQHPVMIDLQGNCLLPGLIDTHNHAIAGGESLLVAHLNDQFSTKEQLESYALEVRTNGKGMRGDVLFIDGLHSDTWNHADELSALFNHSPYDTIPVLLQGSDGHTGWSNRVMLARAGVDRKFIGSLSAEDRKFYGSGKNLEPDGRISEKGFDVFYKVLPPYAITDAQAADAGVKFLNSLGLTAWMDPAVGSTADGVSNKKIATYVALANKRLLTAHVTALLVANGNEDATPQLAVLHDVRKNLDTLGVLTVAGFKIFADGVMEYPTQTAAMSVPYKNSGQAGALMVDPEKFKLFVTAADRDGNIVHVHAIGDRAVTVALDAYEAARRQNDPDALPHSVTHLQVVHPNDISRFRALNVIASMQLLWATADVYTMDLVKPYIDEKLFAYQYPAKSLHDAGAIVAGASDWPVSSANPFDAIYTAETRTGKKGVLHANEIMPRLEMLKAYTLYAARTLRQEKTIGSIAVGKQADFVLVDRDVMAVSADSVKATRVLWTMVGGQKVYARP